MSKISFVIPVYNSEFTVNELVIRIENVINKLENAYDYEIVLVNDFSKDKSLDVCKQICLNNKKVKLISFSKNFGQHSALMAGFRYATGDYIVSMDDDLQTSPEEVPKMLNKLISEDSDVVYAKYIEKKHSAFRNFGSYINNLMALYLLNKPKDITLSSFFVARKFIIDEVVKYENGFPYIGGLILRVTRNISNITVRHNERKFGKSNYSLKKLLKLWLNGFTNFSIKPLRISSLLGFAIFMISFICIIFLIIRKILTPQIQLGWTSIMVTVVFFGGLQLMSIGLVGEYIGRAFLCINKTPQYVIKEMYNFEKDEKNDIF